MFKLFTPPLAVSKQETQNLRPHSIKVTDDLSFFEGKKGQKRAAKK
jgi:hypothetical protein